MSKKSLKALARPIIEKVIAELGYELVDVEYKNPGGPWKLMIYIYKEDGITFKDCEIVSKTLDPLLDSNEDIADRYDFLQVSSAGLDREFKCLADYIRHLNKKVEINLYAPKDGKKKIIGVLKEADEKNIVIEDEDGPIVLTLKDIGKARLAIEF